jgi:hypothetical protein
MKLLHCSDAMIGMAFPHAYEKADKLGNIAWILKSMLSLPAVNELKRSSREIPLPIIESRQTSSRSFRRPSAGVPSPFTSCRVVPTLIRRTAPFVSNQGCSSPRFTCWQKRGRSTYRVRCLRSIPIRYVRETILSGFLPAIGFRLVVRGTRSEWESAACHIRKGCRAGSRSMLILTIWRLAEASFRPRPGQSAGAGLSSPSLSERPPGRTSRLPLIGLAATPGSNRSLRAGSPGWIGRGLQTACSHSRPSSRQ